MAFFEEGVDPDLCMRLRNLADVSEQNLSIEQRTEVRFLERNLGKTREQIRNAVYCGVQLYPSMYLKVGDVWNSRTLRDYYAETMNNRKIESELLGDQKKLAEMLTRQAIGRNKKSLVSSF